MENLNKEKQIDEMAKVIAKADDTCRAKTIAEALYNAGYRKQSEGEWKKDRFGNTKSCSICGDTVTFMSKYCPECGAKMKGGAE